MYYNDNEDDDDASITTTTTTTRTMIISHRQCKCRKRTSENDEDESDNDDEASGHHGRNAFVEKHLGEAVQDGRSMPMSKRAASQRWRSLNALVKGSAFIRTVTQYLMM